LPLFDIGCNLFVRVAAAAAAARVSLVDHNNMS